MALLTTPTRSTIDLFDLDLVFSQQRPLTAEEFIDQCQRRGFHIDLYELELLQHAQALVPLYRFVKNVRPILREGRRVGMPLLTVLVNNLWDGAILSNYLHGVKNVGHPKDPRTEPFQPWRKYVRHYDSHALSTSNFLYSPYQLLLVGDTRPLITKLPRQSEHKPRSRFNRSYSLAVPRLKPAELMKYSTQSAQNDELVFVLTALETKYRPLITGRVTNYRGGRLVEWSDYDKKFDPLAMLQWLKKKPDEITNYAKRLLTIADAIDPLRDWIGLVRRCRAAKWETLRGDALRAMDHRIAAEILLRFHEDLAEAGEAPTLESSPMRFPGPYDSRLGTNRYELTETLMDFGISPQPSLLLVVEGETEMVLIRRVMKTLGVHAGSEFIRLFNSKGIDKKIALLAEYVATPELGKPIRGGFLLTRPPTRILRVVDPESKLASRAERENHRRALIRTLWEAISETQRSQIPRSELRQLVEVKTWNRKGESFEFAHFTDHQIARAILSSYSGPSVPLLAELVYQVSLKRKHRQNIESIWRRWKGRKPTKGRVTEALWPVLEHQIQNTLSRSTHPRIPVVRLILTAVERAGTVHRHSVFIRSKKR